MGAENEPDGASDDWMRIAELQARNKACLPHLKSSYPVEFDVRREAHFTPRQAHTHYRFGSLVVTTVIHMETYLYLGMEM